MRTIWVWALLVFGSGLLLSDGWAQETGNGDDPSEKLNQPAEKPAEKAKERTDLSPAQLHDLAATLKINEALDEMAKIDVLEMPLSDVLQDIAKTHNIPIVLDPEGFEVASVPPDQLITLNFQDISLRNALRALLKPLHLTFAVRHEVLTVTALDCPERLATVRTFPLGDLVNRMDDPSELISALEVIWPEDEPRIGEERPATPRARILANHLVVRGSPRHLDLAELLIDGLMAQRPEPEVRATITLPQSLRPAPAIKEPASRPKFRTPSPQFREPNESTPFDKPRARDLDEPPSER